MTSGSVDLGSTFGNGGGGGGVTSLNTLTGALTLIAGSGITISTGASTITISQSSSGVQSINGDTTSAQTLSVGTSGTDFAIVDAGGGSHVFNLPTASASNRGALSSADWSTFNGKQSTVTIGALDAQTANANGLALVSNVLSSQSATASFPGMVNTAAQTFAGAKTFTGQVLSSSGTAAAPGLAFSAETNSGLYRVTTSNLGLSVAGTEGMDALNIGAGLVNFGFGGTANVGSSQPVMYSRSLNNSVFFEYINPSLGTSMSTVLQIAGGVSSNYLTLENYANNTTNTYLGQGSAIMSSPNQTQLIIGSEGASTFIGFTVGGRTLATEKMRLSSAGALGMANTSPAANTFIDAVNTTGATRRVQVTGYGQFVGYRGRYANGTSGSPTAATSGNVLAFLNAQGYGATGFSAGAATGSVSIQAAGTFTDASMPTDVDIFTTPVGSVTPVQIAQFSNTGATILGAASSTAIHQVNGGLNVTTRTITANLTVDTTTTDYAILCNAAGAITVTLPAPANGRTLVIKDISGNASTNNITVAQHASETIEGVAASYLIQVSYQAITLVSDGTNWWFQNG